LVTRATKSTIADFAAPSFQVSSAISPPRSALRSSS